MEFITSHSIIHRDVAARNFMLAEDYTLKIGDFGRAIVCEDQAGVQILEDSVPVRWSSPEVLSRDWYSSASDVWAFGIAIFEVFSYGRMVYPGKTNEDVVELILDRRRPDQPLDCPDAIYSTCLQCWSYKASNRPSFAELVGYIGSIERRLRGGAEDQDLACSKRFIEYQRRPTERIAEAAGGFSRSRPGSATSRRSTASQVELLKRTSSTMLFDGGYVLLDSVAGVTDHFIVLDPVRHSFQCRLTVARYTYATFVCLLVGERGSRGSRSHSRRSARYSGAGAARHACRDTLATSR